jgi:hypothetical protein
LPALARTIAAALLACSCASTTLRSGLPPGDSPEAYTERWHTAFLFGLVEASGPYALDRICPEGWSEISVEPDPFTALAGVFTLFVYSPSRVTIVCAVPGMQHAEAR